MTRDYSCSTAEMMGACSWCLSDPLYVEYHHCVWGRPQRDSQKLFAALCLEGQQAGLSWITVLKKERAYYDAFVQFDPEAISVFNDLDIDRLMTNANLIRHRKKLEAIVTNAKAYLKMKNNQEPFSDWVWSFVDGKPLVNRWTVLKDVPSQTETSVLLAKALKKRGFRFVGPTTAYAFMQACGLVNDHLVTCPMWLECQNQ